MKPIIVKDPSLAQGAYVASIQFNESWTPKSCMSVEEAKRQFPNAPEFENKQAAVDYVLALKDKVDAAEDMFAALNSLLLVHGNSNIPSSVRVAAWEAARSAFDKAQGK